MSSRQSISDPEPVCVAELVCHPGAPCPAVRSLQGRAGFLDPEVLSLGFTLTADLDRLNLPGQGPFRREDRLWEHTCFEVFLAAGIGTYWEIHLAPSGAWATYRFLGYREGGEPDRTLEPRFVAHRRPGRLELHALLRLPPDLAGRPLRAGLSAVLESAEGDRSYWALRHPPGRPDFHHPDSFAMDLRPEELNP